MAPTMAAMGGAMRGRRDPEPIMPQATDRARFVSVAGGCVGLLVVMACILGVLVVQHAGARALHRKLAITFEAHAALAQVFSIVQDTESGQRGYVLTGHPAFRASYRAARAKVEPALQRLDAAVAGDADQVANRARLRQLIDLKLQELATTVHLREHGRFSAAVAVVETLQGQRLMDGVRATVAAMDERIALKRNAAVQRAEAAGDVTTLLIAFLLCVCVVCAVVASGLTIVTLARRQDLINRLAAQRDQADRATRASSNFLANMSHEIRTPLTSILGFSRLIHEQPGLSKTAAHYNDRVLTAASALLAVVNDVLDFSKLEAGEARIERTAVEPAKVVEDALALFEERAASKGIAVRATTASDVPAAVSADPDRLRQIVLNLVGNAVKFTETGGVEVELSWRAPDWLRVQVVDTGPGITVEDQALLFQRFAQIDGGATRPHAGTGLGLAISKCLVEAMDGSIGVVSSVGGGSCFWFEISAPIATPASLSAASAAGPAAEIAAGARVLLVDDNEANRELGSLLLTTLGMSVTLAGSGEESIAAADRHPFDLILMDIRMPGMGGVEAMKIIRSNRSAGAHTPILAFTAEADVQTAARLRRQGFDGHVAKPISPPALIEAVAHWTARSPRIVPSDARSA